MLTKSATLAASLAITVGSVLTAGTTATTVSRTPFAKTPTALLEVPAHFTGRVTVKFSDSVGMRTSTDGRIRATAGNADKAVLDLLDGLDVRFERAFPGISDERLRSITNRARAISGQVQPDLAGMAYLVGDDDAQLLEAARRLNELDAVEFVQMENGRKSAGDFTGRVFPNARNWREAAQIEAMNDAGVRRLDGRDINIDAHFEPSIATIVRDGVTSMAAAQGVKLDAPSGVVSSVPQSPSRERVVRDDRSWDAVDPNFAGFGEGGDLDCGDDMAESCFDGTNGTAYCDNAACCELICDLDEFCCDEINGGTWDDLCTATANLLCANPVLADPMDPPSPTDPNRCSTGGLNGPCGLPHGNGGCSDGQCCFIVCGMDPTCCDETQGGWDAMCVEMATDLCSTVLAPVPGDPAPDISGIQGYLTTAPYTLPFPNAYPFNEYGLPTIMGGAAAFIGYDGSGLGFGQGEAEPFEDCGCDGDPNVVDADGTQDNGWRDFGADCDFGQPGEPFDDFGLDGMMGTADFGEGDGEFNGPTGLYQIALRAQFRDNINANGIGARSSIRGLNRRVGLITASMYDQHEEFLNRDNAGNPIPGDSRVTVEPGIRPFFDADLVDPNTGTAAASVVFAADEADAGLAAAGIVGIVPEVDPFFFPIIDRGIGPRELSAWAAAIETFDPGDVIFTSYTEAGNISLNFDAGVRLLMSVATATGISVLCPSGDGCIDLENNAEIEDDPLVLVCGAGSAGYGLGRPYRLPSGNYYESGAVAPNNLAASVHLGTWGAYVTAAGFGDIWRVPIADVDGNPLPGTVDPYRTWTAQWGGSAASTAIMTGLTVAFQGFHEFYFGFPASNARLRDAIAPPVVDPNPGRLFGNLGEFQDQGVCALDLTPGLPRNSIGHAATGTEGAVTVLTNQAFSLNESEFLRDIVLVRGERIYGALASVTANDAELYLASPERISPDSDTPLQGPGAGNNADRDPNVIVPELSSAIYLMGGQTVDVAIIGQAPTLDPISMAITIDGGPSESLLVQFLEVYNFDINRWTFVGIAVHAAGAGQTITGQVPSPAAHVDKKGRIVARTYYIGFPLSGLTGIPEEYTAAINFIDLQVDSGIGGG